MIYKVLVSTTHGVPSVFSSCAFPTIHECTDTYKFKRLSLFSVLWGSDIIIIEFFG